MPGGQLDRRLLAILIADVVGYSGLMEADEPGTIARLKAVRTEVVDPSIEGHHGHVVKLMGDGALVTFESIVDAVFCAVDIQRVLAARNAGLSEADRIVLRIGVNLGDVALMDGDVYGDGVNVAARLEHLAEPGGIMVSGTAYDQLQGKLDVELEFIGEQQVKNIARPVRAYRVRLDSVAAPRAIARRRTAGTRRIPRWALGVGTLAVAAIVAVVIWWQLSSNPPHAQALPLIAVLPFENTGDAASARIADAITEDIITDLSRYSDFTVLASNTTGAYRGRPVDVRQIRKDLGVRFVLAGSFQREGELVRVTARLIDSSTGTNLWSERYDRPAADMFAVQSELADRIANSLGNVAGLVATHGVVAAKRKPPGDLGAYELYLLGRETMRSGLTIDSQLKAKELLERAIATDPALARAYVILAWTYAWRVNLEPDRSRLISEMIEVGRRAVELDPMDAEAHQAYGYALGLQGDLKQAEVEFDESLRLNPNSFDILADYACWAWNFGKEQAGGEAVDKAMRLNPNYPQWAIACFRAALFGAGRHEDVVKNQTRLPEDKWNTDDYVHYASSLAELGRIEEAESLVKRGLVKFPAMLSIEAFALNRAMNDMARARLVEGMRKAGFPLCANGNDLAGIANPVRLPECVKAQQ